MQIDTTKEALYPTVFCFLFGDHDLTETPPQSQSMTLEHAQFHHVASQRMYERCDATDSTYYQYYVSNITSYDEVIYLFVISM